MKESEANSEFLIRFNHLLCEIQAMLSEDEIETLNPSDLKRVANIIDGLRPESKLREHKEKLLLYLNRVKALKVQEKNEEGDLSFKARLNLAKQGTLESVLAYLNSFHGFATGNMSIFIEAFLGIIIDALLLATGVAKYYSYIPVFTILFLFKGLRRQKQLKRKGKILNL